MMGYKVKDAQSKPGMTKEYMRDLNTYESTSNYGKKINSGAKPGTIGAHQCTGAMGKGKKGY